jgi:hypothetical protein
MSNKKKALRESGELGDSRTYRRDFLKGIAAVGGASVIATAMPKTLFAAGAERAAESGSERAAGAVAPKAAAGAEKVKRLRKPGPLQTVNGWYVQNGKVIWGYAQSCQWWGGYRGEPHGWWTDCGLRTCIIRNAPGQAGPNKTEDLDSLTDSMVECGFPGYVHTPPLWRDRRRDAHDAQRRLNGNAVYPLLEMPWGRSDQGQAWDGLPRYDLTKFNRWFFQRLKDFADLCDLKGCILFFHFYNQHNLLETQAHYCDYPWRPVNCLQATDLPDTTPAANVFYDVTHPVRREMHQLFIRHCLDVLGGNRNVVFLTGSEYTGPLSFTQFWVDTLLDWQKQRGRKVHIGLGAPKDVADAVLQDPRYRPHIGTIDLHYWHYEPDDTLVAVPGGKEIPGRRLGGERSVGSIRQQVKEYRRQYADKAIIHEFSGGVQTMAFLMSGGSMIVRGLSYVREYPASYDLPLGCKDVLTIYDFIRAQVAEDITRMRPLDIIGKDKEEDVWCLGEPGQSYLIYMPRGDLGFRVDLSEAPGTYQAKWVGMDLGKIFDAFEGSVEGGRVLSLNGLDWRPWLLWLKKRE